MTETLPESSILALTERKRLIESIHITFPRLLRVRSKISYCHTHSKIAAEPECMLIMGRQGAGKTTLCSSYARQFPRVVTKERVMIPVLAASIPAPASVKSLPTRVLRALGDSYPDRGTAVSQTLRIINFFAKCGVELMILDEFQNFIDANSNAILINISNWLKDLINETRKPVVLVGMPHSERILLANPQLERRFSMRETLEPFGWGTAAAQAEFGRFLEELDIRLPFPQRSNLAAVETAMRIFYATQGIVGYVMKLVRRAAIMAIDEGADCLDLELLARAYKERLAARMLSDINPFRCDLESLRNGPWERLKL
jgi:hypothetical protein